MLELCNIPHVDAAHKMIGNATVTATQSQHVVTSMRSAWLEWPGRVGLGQVSYKAAGYVQVVCCGFGSDVAGLLGCESSCRVLTGRGRSV